jgi:hypothetical protein
VKTWFLLPLFTLGLFGVYGDVKKILESTLLFFQSMFSKDDEFYKVCDVFPLYNSNLILHFTFPLINVVHEIRDVVVNKLQ